MSKKYGVISDSYIAWIKLNASQIVVVIVGGDKSKYNGKRFENEECHGWLKHVYGEALGQTAAFYRSAEVNKATPTREIEKNIFFYVYRLEDVFTSISPG